MQYNDLHLIEMDKIVHDGNNVRKKFDNNDLSELKESIKRHGIINPLTVKQDGETYMIVAGERRYQAAKALEWKQIPAIIVEGTDDELKEIQLIENCQRKDMNPIEELEAFMQLISREYTPDDIATRIGKSITYVITRLNLIRLTDRAKQLLYNDIINLSHSKYLVAMESSQQEIALDELTYKDGMDNIQYLPAKNFHDWYMSHQSKKLNEALFDPKDETLIILSNNNVGACTQCKFNSAYNTALFSEFSVEAICSNRTCYDKKTEFYTQNKIKELNKNGFDVIEVSQHASDVYCSEYQFTHVDEETLKKHGMKVENMLVVVEGNNMGNSYPVYSKSQLDTIRKAHQAATTTTTDTKAIQNASKAIERYKSMAVSSIAKKYAQLDSKLTTGVKLLVVFKLFNYLGLKDQFDFIRTLVGDTESKLNTYNEAYEAFSRNISKIYENVDDMISYLCLMNITGEYVMKGEHAYGIIDIMCGEVGLKLDDIKRIVEDETGVDLKEV